MAVRRVARAVERRAKLFLAPIHEGIFGAFENKGLSEGIISEGVRITTSLGLTRLLTEIAGIVGVNSRESRELEREVKDLTLEVRKALSEIANVQKHKKQLNQRWLGIVEGANESVIRAIETCASGGWGLEGIALEVLGEPDQGPDDPEGGAGVVHDGGALLVAHNEG